MTDLSTLTERDILIRLDSKFDMMEARVATLESQVDELRIARANQSGFFAGANFLKTLLTSLPIGAIGWLVGTQ